MGVRNLSSLVHANPEVLKRNFLHDCTVVMDGFNVAFTLYLESNLDCVRGGELGAFADIIRRYFAMYAEANVTCIVVLDGAPEPDMKIATLLERCRQKITSLLPLTTVEATRIKVMPAKAIAVFTEVVWTIGNVEAVQCVFEADEIMAKIANERGCPVISNDSDFFIFNLEQGVIPLTSMDNHTSEKGTRDGNVIRGIQCKLYRLQNLLNMFDPPIKPELMPIFGTIVGNDYVTQEDFGNFFSTIKVPKRCRLRHNHNQIRLVATLNFLSLQTTFDNCLRIVLRNVPQARRAKLEKLFMECTSRYNMQLSLEPTVRFPNGREAPRWLIEEFIGGKQATTILSLIGAAMHLPGISIEPIYMKSSNDIVLPLWRQLHNTVCGGQIDSIVFIDRDGRNLKKTRHIVEQDDCGLFDIENLTDEERDATLRRKLLVKSSAYRLVGSRTGEMVIWALEYMIIHGQVDWVFCVSVLLTCIFAQTLANESGGSCETVNFLLNETIDPQDLGEFRKYSSIEKCSGKVDFAVTHLINQYFATLTAVRDMCRLFRYHAEGFAFHEVADGVLLYNIHKDLSKMKSLEAFVSGLFREKSPCQRRFRELCQSLKRLWFPWND